MDGSRLTLRSVEWAVGPQGRVNLGEASTVTATTTLSLPAPPAPPRWGVAGLVGLRDGHAVYGGAVSAWRGPVGVQAGSIGGVTFAGVGLRW